MTIVTVFDFELPDICAGDYLLAKGKATKEYVSAHYGRVIEGTGIDVDSALLHDGGRYSATLSQQ
ncbi:hypothetical protein [Iodobacter fluviatilis]|uniref:Uncharacterized protein n=1 Tax=Iodobacter fluviatilis TaxID=537 RepID=A0A7G3GCG7_9NEIS|nr:hypothetical protein [Iodobacter fluviatilis]QBC44355.1 hypothetical protein C1H71_13010 [Iodobacter fluviatilis]